MFKLILFFVFLVLSCTADQFEDECGLEGSYAVPLVKEGQEVMPREFPWHVAIFAWHYKNRRYEVICGGSLVMRDLVISAAHCFADKNFEVTDEDDYQVVAGSQLASWTSEERDKQTSEGRFPVRYVRLGEGYRGRERNYHADIAIVQLLYSFNLSDKVRTICLQPEMDMDNWLKSSDRLYGKVAGWGLLTELEVPSNTLKFLRVSVVGNEQCNDRMPATYRRHLIPDKVCVGLANGSSVCQGDSGGGLLLRHDARWYLYGVLSTAPNDTDKYEACPKTTIALYTNIQKYSSWLFKNLKELHRPAYTRPGTPCSTNGIVGVCQEYLLCLSAVEALGIGFQVEKCPNSEPIEVMVCCVSKEKAEEKGRMLGISANTSRNAGSINEQPGEGRPTNATASPGAACKIGGNIGNCQEYLQCPTAVRAAGLGYSIRDMMMDCPNSDLTGMTICCVSEEKADERGQIIGAFVNLGKSRVFAGSPNGEPRGTWTPRALGLWKDMLFKPRSSVGQWIRRLSPDAGLTDEECGEGLPSNAGSTDGQFGGGSPPNAGSTDGQLGGGLPPNAGSTDGQLGGGLPPNAGSTDGQLGGGLPPNAGSTDGQLGGGLPPNAGSTDGQLGGGLPPNAGSTDGQFGGGLPPNAGSTDGQLGGGLPPNAGSTDGQFGGGLPPNAGSTDGQLGGGLPPNAGSTDGQLGGGLPPNAAKRLTNDPI